MIHVLLLISPFAMNAQAPIIAEKYQSLPFGGIKPMGWLKEQMQKDLAGFVGNLDRLVPELIYDPIYGSERLGEQSKVKDLGNLKEGDAAGDEQYKWWNSETQSNWWDGYLRNVLLINDSAGMRKVKEYVAKIIETQDADGYLGIYDKDLRYKFSSENGELWAKTSLLRGLLAYYEFTNDQMVWSAITKAVDNVMDNYPINQSNPFFAGKDFSGGVAHGLTFTDVCDKMYQITKKPKYLDYATFLFRNFSLNHSSEKDVQLQSIFDTSYKLQCHGVHTFEHLRPLIVAAYSSNDLELKEALAIYLKRIKNVTTVTGGPIGDEWIAGRMANCTNTGYEYCSLHELMDSYCLLFQKSGEIEMAEMIERIFYNAAQGSRNPDHSAIAYLKTDNSYEMMGTRNGETEPDRTQTRYKYSPVHQDVAVCCAPNAGRISPYFLQSCWLKQGDNTLIAAVLSPNILETSIHDVPLKIEVHTAYPFQNHFLFRIETGASIAFQLKIRKPEWVTSIQTKSKYRMEDGFLVFDLKLTKNDQIELEFAAEVKVNKDLNHEKSFSYGALVYAKPIAAIGKTGRSYAPGFEDLTYSPIDTARYEFIPNHSAHFKDGKISLSLKNRDTHKIENLELIPIGKTILRQVSFK